MAIHPQRQGLDPARRHSHYGEDKVALIDPDDSAEHYDLPTRRIDFTLDPANPRNSYILNEDAKLHRLDTIDAAIKASESVAKLHSKVWSLARSAATSGCRRWPYHRHQSTCR